MITYIFYSLYYKVYIIKYKKMESVYNENSLGGHKFWISNKNNWITFFKNTFNYSKYIFNSNIIENLFNARRYGIFTWDEEIENSTEWKNTNQVVKDFLQSDPGQEFSVNLEKTTISNIQEIVKYLNPVSIVKVIGVPHG